MNTDLLKQKENIYLACKAIIEERELSYKNAIKMAQEAVGSESKSTAGDKHETGRAMAHLEQEKNSYQLKETQNLLQTISRIDYSKIYTTAVLGSVINTNKGSFFLSVSAGKITVNNELFFAVSLQSPIGLAMANLKNGDSFKVNNQIFVINNIF